MNKNLIDASSAYRADLDGLRAIAVLSVAIFHLHASWMPSGFLGVDIFFVLSGYLISTILFREISGGYFSYARFYLRRIRRILPAFFSVVIGSLLLASFLFVPEDLPRIHGSAIASLFFGANLYYSKGIGYFDASSEENPLLHIWSLSVEEQFYFLFPVLLSGLIAFWRRKTDSDEDLGRGLQCSVALIACLFLASSFLPLKAWGLNWDHYYLPYIRFGELMVGSFLAITLSTAPREQSRTLSLWVGSFSFLLLLICFFLDGVFVGRKFPGPLALVPCGAVAALIWANRQRYWFSQLLSWKPIVWLGKISYSLYLWHWVVLAFLRYYVGTVLPMRFILLACPLILLLSVISYYLIEQPLRHKSLTIRQALVYYYALPGVVVLFFSCSHLSGPSFPDKYVRYSSKNHHQVDTLLGASVAPRVLIAGDSHAMHLFRFFDLVGKREGWSAYASGVASEPFLLDYDFDPTLNMGKGKQRNDSLARVYNQYDVVILASLWGSTGYIEDPKFIPAIDRTLRQLLTAKKHVIMTYSCYGRAQSRVRESYLVYRGFLSPNPSRFTSEELNGDFYDKTKGIAASIERYVRTHYPQVTWLNLADLIPSTLLYKGMPVMSDIHHLNDYGAEMMNEIYKDRGWRLIPSSYLQH